MGYAVVHMMKLSKGAIRGIQSHNQREKDSRNNPDIDKTRSDQNYDLIHHARINYHKEIKDCIEHFATETKTVRKDAVLLCNFIITSDEQTMKSMSLEQQKSFFEDSVKFFGDRYGHENIINATVHMDETTPHLHLGLVPIAGDRLSAKKIFTKLELAQLQTEFARDVGQIYNLERGQEGSTRTHLSEVKFKIVTAQKENEQLKEDIKGLHQERDTLKNDCSALKMSLNEIKDKRYNLEEINAINGQKTFLNANEIKVDAKKFDKLKEMAKKSSVLEYENTRLESENDRRKGHIFELQEKNYKQSEELKSKTKELEEKKEFLQETGQDDKFKLFLLEKAEKERKEKELLKTKNKDIGRAGRDDR